MTMSRSIALALDELVSAAQYFGSLTDNDQAAYDAIEWQDARRQPTWSQVVAQRDRRPSRAELLIAVNAKRDAIVAGGYHHPFGGTIGTRILDLRNSDDAAAWNRVKTRAMDAIAASDEGRMMEIIDARNAIFQVAADKLDEALTGLFDWRDSLQMRGRVLKNQITSAADQAALNAIDINAGWPE